jgi:hypothetical protein
MCYCSWILEEKLYNSNAKLGGHTQRMSIVILRP